MFSLGVIGCDGCWPFKSDRWSGFVYPDKSDLRQSTELGDFPTLEACRASCQSVLNRLPEPSDGDYECGLNCEPQGGLYVCKETER